MTTDFIIIGAGVVGLSVARMLKQAYPRHRVVVLEKEARPGVHASGRNSGVLHSGIYYTPGTLKARICAQGARELAEYCTERGLSVNRLGKLLVPVRAEDGPQLDLLESHGRANGVATDRLDASALRSLEPHVRSATGTALRVPGTAVVSPTAVIEALTHDVLSAGVELLCGGRLNAVDPVRRTVTWNGMIWHYGHTVNCAGVHADTVAHLFGTARRFTVLPFRGAYWKLNPSSKIRVQHLIYPVPDLRVPFLGVHTTTTTRGEVYLGPTATPAFGRESYRPLAGVTSREALRITGQLARQLVVGGGRFRTLAWTEARRMLKPGFLGAARALLPELQAADLLPSTKAGIRAQLLDTSTGELVMDFLVERSVGATHVLNAISPAFTCAFPLARLLVDEYISSSPALTSNQVTEPTQA